MKNLAGNKNCQRFYTCFSPATKQGQNLLFPLLLAVLLFSIWTPNLYSQFYSQKYAVVVGVDKYPHVNFADLNYARKDAEGVARILRTLGFQVYPLYDADATKEKIISLLEDQLAPRLTNGDAVLFFFAGHGTTRRLANQDWGYIVPCNGTEKAASYISMEEIRTLSEKMGTARHQVFIMDCCYGGQLGSRGDKVPENIPHYLQDVSTRVARQILTAGGKNQRVMDGGPSGHSVFTGYFIKAITEGLADINSDGWITFCELVTFIQSAATRPNQTPGWGTMPGHELGEFLWKSLKPTITETKPREILPETPDRRSELNPITNSKLDQLGVELVSVKGGAFEMGDVIGDGSSDERPVHSVTVSNFSMSKTEVTVGQFRKFVDATGYRTDAEKQGWAWAWTGSTWDKVNGASWRKPGFTQSDDHPVVAVSWNDAIEFCKWANCRLPTEAEWEYACRAGTTTPFHTGDNLTTDQANYDGNYPYKNYPKGKYIGKTTQVGSYPPNAWGLYDMHGNVWEWCSDWYGEKYYDECKKKGIVENPMGPETGSRRVLRGGSWDITASNCRSAYRPGGYPDSRIDRCGFRLVFVPQSVGSSSVHTLEQRRVVGTE
jgi:formylglycine-generating enzyme required for sulfatase activity